jgi:hypothetical protein
MVLNATKLCVAFEPIASRNDVISMLSWGRTYEQQLGRHAVLLVWRNDGTLAGFEANPSRMFNGSLVARYRTPHPFNRRWGCRIWSRTCIQIGGEMPDAKARQGADLCFWYGYPSQNAKTSFSSADTLG